MKLRCDISDGKGRASEDCAEEGPAHNLGTPVEGVAASKMPELVDFVRALARDLARVDAGYEMEGREKMSVRDEVDGDRDWRRSLNDGSGPRAR